MGRLKSARLRRRDLPRCWRSRNSMPPHVRSRLPATSYDSKARDGIITLYGKTGWRFSSTPNLDGGRDECGLLAEYRLPAATDAPKRVAIGMTLPSKLNIL